MTLARDISRNIIRMPGFRCGTVDIGRDLFMGRSGARDDRMGRSRPFDWDIEREHVGRGRTPSTGCPKLAVIIVCALVISPLLRAFLVQVTDPSASMRNTLVEKKTASLYLAFPFTGISSVEMFSGF